MTPATSGFFCKVAADGTRDSTAPLDGSTAYGTDVTTAPISAGLYGRALVVLTCPATGAPVGTVKLQGSIDNSRGPNTEPDAAITNWVDIPFVDQSTGAIVTTQALSGASTIAFEDTECAFRWLRLLYVRTSGSITPTAKIQMKGSDL